MNQEIKAAFLRIKSVQRECEILQLKLEKNDEVLTLTQILEVLGDVEKELFGLNNQLGPLPCECEQSPLGAR